MDPNYRVIFDLADAGYRTWWFAVPGLFFVAFGIYALTHPNFLATPKLPHYRKVLFSIWIAFASLWTIASAYSTLAEYRRLRAAYDHHTYQVVEGRVVDFHPLSWATNGTEKFTVNGVTFAYARSLVTAGFNHSGGSKIREGLRVRVWYVGNTIIHLEVATGDSSQAQLPAPARARDG